MSSFKIYLGDITKLNCDVIVNAANKTLLGGGGVDGAIHRAAGTGLLEECRKLHGCNTGQAKMTNGYNLPAKYVIHTVGPIYKGVADDAINLSNCYWNSLELVRENNLKSIAFSAISTGVYGYPLEKATKIAISTVREWIEKNKDYELEIIFCCFDEKVARVYRKIIEE